MVWNLKSYHVSLIRVILEEVVSTCTTKQLYGGLDVSYNASFDKWWRNGNMVSANIPRFSRIIHIHTIRTTDEPRSAKLWFRAQLVFVFQNIFLPNVLPEY